MVTQLLEWLRAGERRGSSLYSLYMKGVSVRLDDETMAQLDQVAPPRNGARAEFIRLAIKAAIIRSEFERIGSRTCESLK